MSFAEQLAWDGLPDVSRVTDKVEGSHRRLAECRRRFDSLSGELDRAFVRYGQVQAELAELGVRADFTLDPPLAAAFGAWKARGPRETRVELLNVSEAPIPEAGE